MLGTLIALLEDTARETASQPLKKLKKKQQDKKVRACVDGRGVANAASKVVSSYL